jgi:hypothetical protein
VRWWVARQTFLDQEQLILSKDKIREAAIQAHGKRREHKNAGLSVRQQKPSCSCGFGTFDLFATMTSAWEAI